MSVAVLGIAIAVLIALRVPIAFAILGPCLLYMWSHDQSVGFAMRTATNGVNSWPLLAVPLFILVGFLATRAGIAERVFALILSLVGRVRGALGYVNIGVSLGFSWMNGSALADAAGVGSIEIPHMQKKGYPTKFAVGLTAASSVVGPIMPPSIPAVVFASVAIVSTSALFAAAIVPALLICVALAVYVFFWARGHEELRSEEFSWREVRSTLVGGLGALFAPVIILGGILGGYFTPTEAAAVGAVYMLLLGFLYRSLKLRDLPKVFADTAATTAAIMVILGASSLLGWILAREQVPQNVASAFLELTDSTFVFLIIVNLLLLVLGAVIEPTSALVISVPVLLPVATQLGVDPVHFGVIVVLNLMIGLMTPPIGGVLFVLSSVTKTPVSTVFSGVAPFLVPLLAVLLIVTFVPALSLWLPTLLGL
ncbi:tripartite ATP-independent transporter DctM subunit [Mumia flava]|uniref:Tripartite ATP-independent transporter DctM subunit n=1 Tax=Mumia flava TaxID=1348852 RepID=A0A0B2BQW1_9ACTN|nr:TRAP transporter large permease [Mumia flava]PJJ58042.1 tripartite ATP-independent transporter DctM subunit [Mumia flava]